jgi:hypothetical protein
MMRKFLAFFCAVLNIYSFASAPARAVNIFSDNFDSGVNSSSTWALVNPGQSLLNGDNAHAFGAQSAKQVNAFTDGVSDVYYMKTQSTAFTNPGPVLAGTKEIARVEFFDDNNQTDANGDGSIDIKGGLMLAGSYSSTDFYQLGVNSGAVAGNSDVTNYFVRTAAEGNQVTSIPRTQGWHELRIEVYPWTGAVGDVLFYIDNVLANPVGFGKRRAAGPVDMNEIRLGISVRTPDSPFWFDNVSLDMVPEPTSVVLLVSGCLALAGYLRRLQRDPRA